jgi:predicted secreted protein with PEFG-CTERM motif
MALILVIVVLGFSVITIPVFAVEKGQVHGQEMGWYQNELYDFSFDIPMNWRYYEDYPLQDGTILQTLHYPKEFEPIYSIFDTPNIFVIFENIPESEIPNLNAKAIEKYQLEQLRVTLPNAKIINYEIKSTSYGWEFNIEYVVSLNIPFVVRGEFQEEYRVFYFKDSREAYLVGYLSPVEYFEPYYPVFENALDSLVIKGVVVPEFHEIALMVLGSSIVFVIILARRFTKV